MALNETQLIALRKARFDEDLIEAAFPVVLPPEEWSGAVLERQKVIKGKSKTLLVDQGVAWEKEGHLLTERRRSKPLNHFAANAIPILMVSNGGGWVAELRLWYLAHRQLAIDPPQLLPCGSIKSEQLVQEFKGKILASIRFAKPFVEPLLLPESVVRDYLESPPSKKKSKKLRDAIKSAPSFKFPQRHQSAETLLYACQDILKELEACGKSVSPNVLGSWSHLLSRVFEAGKAHAYLERDKDPDALAENLKGAQMIGKTPSISRKLMEGAFEAFFLKRKRPPTITELRQQLMARKVPAVERADPAMWAFADQTVPVPAFKNAFKAISRKYKRLCD
jgi:hypothetical protein